MPNITQYARGNGVRVRFRELITPSVGTTSNQFSVTNTFYLNPGLRDSFPWLSTLAQNFDQYMVHSLQIDYVNSAAATLSGFIYMVYDYDVDDGVPTTAQEMMNQLGAVSCPLWQPVSMKCVPKAAMSLGPRRFIRTVMTDRELVTTDVAKLHMGFAAGSGATGVTLGQVWVSYDISLLVPQIRPTDSLPSRKHTLIKHTSPSATSLSNNVLTKLPSNASLNAVVNAARALIPTGVAVSEPQFVIPYGNYSGDFSFEASAAYLGTPGPAATLSALLEYFNHTTSSWTQMPYTIIDNTLQDTTSAQRLTASRSFNLIADHIPGIASPQNYMYLRPAVAQTNSGGHDLSGTYETNIDLNSSKGGLGHLVSLASLDAPASVTS
jgi:hypothetical protein